MAQFKDKDAQPVRRLELIDWERYQSSGYRSISYNTTFYDHWGSYWAFNQIIYGNSDRYRLDPSKRAFCCVANYEVGSPPTKDREEAYSELWEKYPGDLLTLIEQSECAPVHRFAANILKDCRDFCDKLELSSILMLLAAPYEATAELGFEIVQRQYDPHQPNFDLIVAIANCALPRAREQAHQWMVDHNHRLFADADRLLTLVTSQHSDTRRATRNALKGVPFTNSDAQVIVGRLIAHLMALEENDGALAGDIVETMSTCFGEQLSEVGIDVIRDALQHKLEEVQRFAGDLIYSHRTLSQDPPEDIVTTLLGSTHESCRTIAVRIIGQLPPHVLKNRLDLLIALTRHERSDVRDTIRGTVRELADQDAQFGKTIAEQLLLALLVPGAPEGVPTHTSLVLREDLHNHLANTSSETVWRLLQSKSMPAQELGGTLLASNVNRDELSVEEIFGLANHQILSVREAAWEMSRGGVDRIRDDMDPLAKLADAKWEDSRAFAFKFIRDNFSDALSTDVIVGICDSIQADVQAFGCELARQRLQSADYGEELLLKLSEHPSEFMQRFAAELLDDFARDKPQHLEQLRPFLVTLFSRVNSARVAKNEALHFMCQEALKTEQAAVIVAGILSRQSATVAIGDRAASIAAMVKIRDAYPGIELPIEIRPAEVRE